MDFRHFCEINGLILPHEPIPSGKIVRVPTTAHPRKKNGWYVYHGSHGYCQAFDIDPTSHMWHQDDSAPDAMSKEEIQRIKDLAEQERKKTKEEQRAAAQKACEMLKACVLSYHPYLEAKGFPEHRGLVYPDTGGLMIPMRDVNAYKSVLSLQHIHPDGTKEFLKGGKASGAVFVMGRGEMFILCEGYATGLSILAATQKMRLHACIAVCFSAGNMLRVGNHISKRKMLIVDNDASGTGKRVAEQSGLAWGMPPKVGWDANDWHVNEGLHPLMNMISTTLKQSRIHHAEGPENRSKA